MIFTTRPLKVSHQMSEKPIEDFLKHQLTQEETSSLTRKAFFTRVIGVEKNENAFLQRIKEIDTCFLNEAKNRIYVRTDGLKANLLPQETVGYLETYETWLKLKEARPEAQFNIPFPAKLYSDTLEWTKRCAFKEVVQLYEQYIPHANMSTTKNFAVKLLSLMATYLPMLMVESKQLPAKFVYVGPIKRQEFLFLYFLFLMGCDVLYINPVEDSLADFEEVNLISKVHHYQAKLQKQPNLISFEDYQKEVTKKQGTRPAVQIQRMPQPGGVQGHNAPEVSKQEENEIDGNMRRGTINLGRGRKESVGQVVKEQTPRTPVSLTPNRSVPHRGVVSQQPTKVETPSSIRMPAPARRQEEKDSRGYKGSQRELSYEELAQLSTSIVMITVLDGQGRAFKGGSGVVIHEEGYILTNFHVVRDGCHFEVQFENETQTYTTSRIVKYHPNYDLALIKVEKRARPLPLYREDHLARGQKVVAIGSPLGLFNTVSDGIISAFREIQDMSMIQFTAPISNGSSGGALLDMYGRLIGIITAGFDAGQNLNLAVKGEQIYYFANNFL